MNNLNNFARHKLHLIESKSQLREYYEAEKISLTEIVVQGKKYISFACNDYLGFAQNEEIKEYAGNILAKYGCGAGASRLLSGNNILYQKLEKLLAKNKNAEDACVFGSGYLANIGVIPALVSRGDLVISDKLVHSCILDGIKISAAKHFRFLHNDINSLEKLLIMQRKSYKNCLIIVESIYSMDGDLAPLDAVTKLAQKYNSWVLCDDAHSCFVPKSVVPDNFIWLGTMSKALGAYGGYVAGSVDFISYIKNSARSLMFSTGLPPATLATAVKALEIIKKTPELTEKPLKNARYFNKNANSQIVPRIVGDNKKTLELAKKLKKNGVLVAAIRPPTVAVGSSRIRLSFSAAHSKNQIEKLRELL